MLVAGYLSIDTIQSALGRADEVPGGAALYAALGARLAGAEAAIAACVGEDYPDQWLHLLDALGIDTAGIERRPGPTRRARLAYGNAGARRSAHGAAWWERTHALAPAPSSDAVKRAAMVVACPMPIDRLEQWISGAKTQGVPVLADTSEAFVTASRDRLLAALASITIFAPSREETRLMGSFGSDDEAALSLARLGPHVLQKRGADGVAAVASRGTEAVVIPAPPARLVDPTGAGDATVGALAATLAAGRPFLEAARQALAAGAVAVSAIGPAALGFNERAQGTRRRA